MFLFDEPLSNLDAKLRVQMRAEVILYIATGGQALTARVDVHTGAKVGRTLDFLFDMRKVHFFDKDSEQTIV